MVSQVKDLWNLALDQRHTDPDELATAVRIESRAEKIDFRTRLLIRDSLNALEEYWGTEQLESWLAHCPERPKLVSIWREDLGEPGFPFLKEQVMEPTRPEQIERLLRDVGEELHKTVKVNIGGSASLILLGYLSRRTQDV